MVPYSLFKVVLWCYFSYGAQQDSLHKSLMARFSKGIHPNEDILLFEKETQSLWEGTLYASLS